MKTCGAAVGNVSVILAFVLIEHMTVIPIKLEEIWNHFIATTVSALVQPCLRTGFATHCYMETKRRNTFSALVQPCLSTGFATYCFMETKRRNTFSALVQPCLSTYTASHVYMGTRLFAILCPYSVLKPGTRGKGKQNNLTFDISVLFKGTNKIFDLVQIYKKPFYNNAQINRIDSKFTTLKLVEYRA